MSIAPDGFGQDVELEPDTDQIVQTEVQEDEQPKFRVPVDACVEGIVKVQPMPARTSRIRTVTLAANTARQIVPEDPRRSMLKVSASGSFFIGGSQAEALSELSRYLLPVGAALPSEHFYTTDEIWGCAGDNETKIYIYTEQWAN